MQSTTPSSSNLFRENALKHANSTNEIYHTLAVVTPTAWMGIGVALALLLSFLIWASAGKIEMNVSANGIILPINGQALPILATQPGNITKVYVNSGSQVSKGQLLATVFNPYLEEDLKYLNKKYSDSEKQLNDYQLEYNSKRNNLLQQMQTQEKLYLERQNNNKQKLMALESLYEKKLALYKKHYLTIPDINKAKEEYLTAKEEQTKIDLEQNTSSIQIKEALTLLDEKLNQYTEQFQTNRHELDKKLLENKNGMNIISPENGLIINSNISYGDTVNAGKTLFSLITNNTKENLAAIIFINHTDGKKISPGMQAHLLPNNLSPYEYGYLKGNIISISEFPASKEAAYSYLGNMNLVDEFFSNGTPFIAKIQLISNNKTRSQLAWTTKTGSPYQINAGTTVAVKITYKSCAPINLLTKCHN